MLKRSVLFFARKLKHQDDVYENKRRTQNKRNILYETRPLVRIVARYLIRDESSWRKNKSALVSSTPLFLSPYPFLPLMKYHKTKKKCQHFANQVTLPTKYNLNFPEALFRGFGRPTPNDIGTLTAELIRKLYLVLV